jgi:NAD(P)H-dependent flavin oxidoreductase YrpB (nitropropane dioxygenase family)
VQVGTLFAYCDESGVAPELKERVLAGIAVGQARVRTDPRASPTGYPFKVVYVEGLENQSDSRERNCDLGYLRTAYRTPDGKLGYRCAAEPVDQYVKKGGDIADTVGRRCLCNGLTANIGQAQHRADGDELPLLTSGDDLVSLDTFARGRERYSAADVIDYLCDDATVPDR